MIMSWVSIPSESGLFLRYYQKKVVGSINNVSIPSESGLFLRYLMARRLHQRLLQVSIPSESGLFLRLGKISIMKIFLKVSIPSESGLFLRLVLLLKLLRLAMLVSIPSESGLFLRCRIIRGCSIKRWWFQSPQNRGYSSDKSLNLRWPFVGLRFNPLRIGAIPQIAVSKEDYDKISIVSIPSESGLFLRLRSTTMAEKTHVGFNPLRIGAIPQIAKPWTSVL